MIPCAPPNAGYPSLLKTCDALVGLYGSVYLLTVSSSPISVTIANITDPYNATFASSLTPGTKYPALYGATSITTATIENSTYALVASINDNGGVQTIQVSLH